MELSQAADSRKGKVDIKKNQRLRPEAGYPFFSYYLGEANPSGDRQPIFVRELIEQSCDSVNFLLPTKDYSLLQRKKATLSGAPLIKCRKSRLFSFLITSIDNQQRHIS